MKTKFLILLALLFSVISFAQQGINYKAVIKDNSGNVVANQTVTIQFSILKGAEQNNQYTETHNPTTDNNGIVIVNIGEGTLVNGNYATINWGSEDHFLKVEVDTGSGFENMGTTEFKAVPYALNVTGLEAIDEGNGRGWRLKGRTPNLYGNIGNGAIDLSFSGSPSLTHGATESYSTAMGYSTEASEYASTAMGSRSKATEIYSTAMGYFTEASGIASTAMGSDTKASSYASTAIGKFNIGGGIADVWLPTDPLFEIGNGDFLTSSNALTVLKNGTITAPSLTNALITLAGNKALITKEYFDANELTSINDLTDGKSDANGSSVFLGLDAGLNDDGNNGNVGIGYQALASNTTGSQNTANGHDALSSNTTGNSNTANGLGALSSNTTGGLNTANGSYALTSNTTGDFNTANGVNVLSSNTAGNFNIGNGYRALFSNTTGGFNTANGSYALSLNITGNNNTAVGNRSGYNIKGSGNVTIGNDAGYYEIGSNTLYIDNSSANANNALIYGRFDTDFLRFNANVAVKGTLNLNENTTGEGVALRVQGDEALWYNGTYFSYGFGGSANFFADNVGIGITNPNAQLDVNGNIEYTGTLTDVSDRRLKENLNPITNVLGQLQNIKGYTYNMKDDVTKKREYGVIAQDVQKVFPEMVSIIDDKDHLGVSYVQLIPVLLEAIKEQQKIIDQQNSKINGLSAELTEKDIALSQFDKRLKQLETQIKTSNQ
ncbi:tail fiber domain-containing protein [Xanthomarina sp. GH4-25]|uniref:tail fiber domain-containing protein n=1 Tax=Xanthomarina sp. GH4-25 TaxID=3349335 RepID=UPI003877FB4A